MRWTSGSSRFFTYGMSWKLWLGWLHNGQRFCPSSQRITWFGEIGRYIHSAKASNCKESPCSRRRVAWFVEAEAAMNSDRRHAIATVTMPSLVLESIFDDCDRYDHDETGGRILGEFRRAADGSLEVTVTGVIEAGPKARRSSTSFFQDGDYQAEIFRQIETANPEVEHLGNWHTHHVNGFPTLSGGDIATYRRIVNHEKHNLDFFYALLVVSRMSGGEAASRYSVKHYILLRGDDAVYEVDPADVIITRKAPVWPLSLKPEASGTGSRPEQRSPNQGWCDNSGTLSVATAVLVEACRYTVLEGRAGTG